MPKKRMLQYTGMLHEKGMKQFVSTHLTDQQIAALYLQLFGRVIRGEPDHVAKARFLVTVARREGMLKVLKEKMNQMLADS